MRPSDSSKPSYVARIERIEADGRGANVRVHVRWYYRPEESIGGRRPFHGSKEVFLSDHYDLQSADTIEAKCTVHSLKGYTKLDAVGNDDFFCRFDYNSSTGAFSPDRVAVYCKCEMPYNPDDLMVQCEGCSDWFHPACIDMNVEEAKRLDHFFCENCSSESQKKLQNNLTASRHSDTKTNDVCYEINFLNALASSSENMNADVFYGGSMREGANTHSKTELSLLLFPEIDKRRGDGHSRLVYLKWIIVITNFVLELPSAVFDQLSSVQKPQYALMAMLFSLISVLVCIIEHIIKGWKETTVIDIIGLACAIAQFIATAVNFSFVHRNDDGPIKISVWPIIFASVLLCSKVIERRNRKTPSSKDY